MDKYNELRNEYPVFYYHGFDITYDDNIFITYHFEIKDLITFNPTLTIPKKGKVTYDKSFLEKIVFSAGLAEIASYWKATCSKNIVIECGTLTEDQTNWFKKLLFNGLGEFFYVNNINVSINDFVNVESSGSNYDVIDTKTNYEGYLVAIGGGKDSLTSLEILRNEHNKKAFIINNRKVCFDGALTSGIKEEDIINVSRNFDRKITDLNAKGFLNGHTPISSCIAFISYMTAYVYNIKYVVLSNESSANEVSVKGTNVNHQYSKSFEFEEDFRYYCNKYLSNNFEYFSLLRPLSELEIMKIFTKYPKYFKHFISCNNGGKRKNIGVTDGWCCSCAKCLFIYLIMSNFVSEEVMISTFGENLLDNKDMLPYFIDLIGKSDAKPFECVGTTKEVNYVINSIIRRGGKLPYLINYYKDNYGYVTPDDNMLNEFNNDNNVPDNLIINIKEELKND